MISNSVILLLEDEDTGDFKGIISMWKLDINKNPIKRSIPEPKGCLATKPRKLQTRRKQVKFDRAWVHYYNEEEGEKDYSTWGY